MTTPDPRLALTLAACLLACGRAGTEPRPTSTVPPPAASGEAQEASRCPLDDQYEARRPQTGAKAKLPPVPTLPDRALRSGEDFTVWGASVSLRSELHRAEVTKEPISVIGYITKTNIPDAPRCAVHRGGKADPENCFAPVPTFWLGDTKDATQGDALRVMGWASNYAQIYDAMQHYDSGRASGPYLDTFWGVEVPNPLPAAGARVRVTGRYGKSFTMATSGAEEDPIMGILTFVKIEVLEAAPELATLPGMTRKPR